MTTGKTIALTRQTFVSKVMSLLLNMLLRLVIAFLPRSNHLLISWLQSPSAVLLSESEVAQSCPTLCDTMDSGLHQPPPSMGFSRQEYWSGLTFPSPGNLPDPGIEQRSPACRQTLYRLSHQGSPQCSWSWRNKVCQFPLFPHLCHEVMGLDVMVFFF